MRSLSREFLSERLEYNPSTGTLKWKYPYIKQRKFPQAGHASSNGYLRVVFSGQEYRAHRIAWCLATGEWPKEQIDHINGNKTDNRLINLREVSNRQNQHNQKKHRSGTHPGVRYCFSSKAWTVKISKGKAYYLGQFKKKEDAVALHRKAMAIIECDNFSESELLKLKVFSRRIVYIKDTRTEKIYNNFRVAAETLGMKTHTFYSQVRGINPNETGFFVCDENGIKVHINGVKALIKDTSKKAKELGQ